MTLLEDANLKSLFREPLDEDLLRSAYEKLDDESCPFRCNLFALQVRELLRIVIDRISPEGSIKESSWFQAAQELRSESDRGKVTRRDRYRFAITGSISDDAIEHHPILDSTRSTGKLAKLSALLSKFAHISTGTYKLREKETASFRREVENVVAEFAKAFVEIRENTQELLWEEISDIVYDAITGMELESGMMSTQVLVGGFHVLELQEIHLSSSRPSFSGLGEVEIQYAMGSRGDMDYAEMWKPVKFEVSVDPETLDVVEPVVYLQTRLGED